MIILFYFEKEGKNLQYYASECMVSEDSFKESRIISRIIELNQAVEINGPAVKYDIRINKNAN